MLDKIFKKTVDEKNLQIDYDNLLLITQQDFIDLLHAEIKQSKISEMKLDGDRRHKFVYFKAKRDWYSFTWDVQKKELYLHRQIKKQDWKCLFGWRDVS